MPCVGFIEEVIFRGFLFKALAENNVKSAVIISSVTFGLGHLVNLFNGSGMDLINNLCQICFAINTLNIFANEAGFTVENNILKF
ncbi:MAG: CPBP family intramembrane metalloprotease [Lachnospiraceae bacterium]|nr:CPBP family intramembrane metalloprotease [Lachnospiraceae bacterium]